MRYFIVGYPKMFEMKYGIYDYKIEDTTYEEAQKIGAQLSHEVIEEFCHPKEEWYSHEDYIKENNLEKWNNEYSENYEAIVDSIINEQIEYKIWQVKEETSQEAIHLWANSNDDVNEFVQRYCIQNI